MDSFFVLLCNLSNFINDFISAFSARHFDYSPGKKNKKTLPGAHVSIQPFSFTERKLSVMPSCSLPVLTHSSCTSTFGDTRLTCLRVWVLIHLKLTLTSVSDAGCKGVWSRNKGMSNICNGIPPACTTGAAYLLWGEVSV